MVVVGEVSNGPALEEAGANERGADLLESDWRGNIGLPAVGGNVENGLKASVDGGSLRAEDVFGEGNKEGVGVGVVKSAGKNVGLGAGELKIMEVGVVDGSAWVFSSGNIEFAGLRDDSLDAASVIS